MIIINCTVSFLIEKHIYVDDVKDETEAIKRASEFLLEILNRGIINYAKIDTSMQPVKDKENKNGRYTML